MVTCLSTLTWVAALLRPLSVLSPLRATPVIITPFVSSPSTANANRHPSGETANATMLSAAPSQSSFRSVSLPPSDTCNSRPFSDTAHTSPSRPSVIDRIDSPENITPQDAPSDFRHSTTPSARNTAPPDEEKTKPRASSYPGASPTRNGLELARETICPPVNVYTPTVGCSVVSFTFASASE